MQGHDDILGSHYDSYDIIYYTLERSVSSDDTLFHPPNNMKCGDFPGNSTQLNSTPRPQYGVQLSFFFFFVLFCFCMGPVACYLLSLLI